MAVDLAGVITGGLIGLTGGLGGILLGHLLTKRRDVVNRSIDGLRLVVAEQSRIARLALFFERQINMGPKDEEPLACVNRLIQSPEFGERVLELQETNWRFPCMAYLPEAITEFERIDDLMGYVIDPYSRKPDDPNELNSEQAWAEIRCLIQLSREKVSKRLEQLR